MSRIPLVPDSPIEAAPLPEVRNHTPFPSQYFQILDTDDQVFHVLVSRITYSLDQLDEAGFPQLAAKQQALAQSDTFYGAVNASSLIEESDFAAYKPRCDVLFTHATAYPPEGRAAVRWPVGVRIGPWRKLMAVCGPRSMRTSVLGWKLDEPEPALQVPIRYELAFGGTCLWPPQVSPKGTTAADTTGQDAAEILYRHAANPLGRGLLHVPWLKQARPRELAAPQMEVLDEPLDERRLHRQDYPVMGLGAIGRWWQPRLALAGTYDEHWKAERWPHLPRDFDPAYWNCAPPDQQIDYPQGEEEVVLLGLTPGGGRFQMRLPARAPHTLARLHAGPILPRPMPLDTLIFDMHRMTLSCVHRMLIAADADVRVLEIRRRDV